MSEGINRYSKMLFVALTGLIIGSLVYRYYAFALFYQEQKEISAEIKEISLEYREISLWHQERKNQDKTISADRPKIVIKIERD